MLNGMAPEGGVGGVIFLVPKRAADVPLTRISASYDSTARLGTHLDVGRRFGADNEWGIRVNGLYRKGEGPIEGQNRDLRTGSVALDYRGERFRIALDSYAQKDRSDGGIYGISFVGAPGRVPDFSKPIGLGDSSKLDDRTVMFRGEYDISTEITAFAAYGRHQSSIFGTRLVVGGVASDGSYRGGFSLQDSAFKIHTGEAGLRTNFTTGAV